jgi:hypothetical protein
MPIVKLKEILATNYVDNLVVGDSLVLKQVEDPDESGLFMRSGEGGAIVGYRAPNQDLEWKKSITSDLTLDSSEKLVIDLGIDNDVSTANGTWAFVCKIENGSSRQTDTVNLYFKDQNDNILGEKEFDVDKGATGYPVTFFHAFKNDFLSGTTFRIYAKSKKDSIIKGTLTPTTLKIIEARAASI